MEVGLVRSIDIDQTMQQAYLDYAMSVIVARALPDARDGLKPVHRRILYAMFDMGLRPDTAYKKSARIVGEVLGKYHPHGDMAVYESMARMAQDFSMRCLLVEGQGNFGSVDGDPPAAMRYTEARLTEPAMQMLSDIRKNTVDFSDNFDGSLQEPDVLPSALPNMLVNGATGIAVGMSTNIPPHNLGEVVDALVYMLGNWERLDDVNIEDLMKFIQGPDFPTGGVIVQDTHEDDLNAAYGTGRGRVTVQARCHIEEITRGRSRIIVTELPYMTNKSSLIEHIAQLAREGNLDGLADLRDESDRHGLRIVIELTRTAEPEKVLQNLYKRTAMRSTFGIIMLALVDGEPRMLSLKQALRVYLDHRLVVVHRRSEYELEKARLRLHILEGLRVALKHLDEIIDLIKKAPDAEVARDRLMKRYRLSDIQAQAILDMQLRRLAALERKKIEDEYKDLVVQIKALESLIKSPLKMRQTVAAELQQVKQDYADRRRTQITRLGAGAKSVLPVLTATDLLPEQTVWVSATIDGLISRTLDDKPPRISGTLAPRFLLQVNTRDTLFLVSAKGEAAGIPVQTLPEAPNPQDGSPMHKVSALSDADQLAALFTLPPKEERLEGWFLFTATRQGMLKKTALEELPGPTGHSFTLVKVNEDDQLGWVRLTDGQADILLATAAGMAIRFHENDVRPMGLVAAGVNGIKLGPGDALIGMELIPRRGEVLLITSDGKAKRLEIAQFPVQGRYGQGVIAWKLPHTSRLVGLAVGRPTTRLTVLIDKLAPKAFRLDEAPLQARSAAGKPVLDLKAGYQVLGLSIPWAVPRPAAGEKPAPPLDVQVPEEIEDVQEPAIEQLSFGMDEQGTEPASKAKPARKKSPVAKANPPASAPKAPVKAAKTASLSSSKAEAQPATPSQPTQPKPVAGKSAVPQKSAPGRQASRSSQKPASSPTLPGDFIPFIHPDETTGKSKTKPGVKKVVKPATKSSAKTVEKTTTGPIKKATAKPGTTPDTKGTAKPGAQPVKKATAKPGTTPAVKTTAKPAARSTAKPAKKPASKAAAEPTPQASNAGSKSKPASKPSPKRSAQPAKNKPATKPKVVKQPSSTKAKPAPAQGKKPPKTSATGKAPAKKPASKATKARKPGPSGFSVKSLDTVVPNVVIPPGWKPATKKKPQPKRKPKSSP